MRETLVQTLSLPAEICTHISYHTALGYGGCFGVCCFCLLLLTLCLFAYTFTLHLDIYHCRDGLFFLVWYPKHQVMKPSSHAQSLCCSRLWNLLRKSKWARKNTENYSAYNSWLVRMFSWEGGLILPRTQTNTLLFMGENTFQSFSSYGWVLDVSVCWKRQIAKLSGTIASNNIWGYEERCSKNQWCSDFHFRNNKLVWLAFFLTCGYPRRKQLHFWSDDEQKKQLLTQS